MTEKICYCFNISAEEIRSEVRQNNGRSLLLEKIIAEKVQGTCNCITEHPEGR